jgi:hypothetical protein
MIPIGIVAKSKIVTVTYFLIDSPFKKQGPPSFHFPVPFDPNSMPLKIIRESIFRRLYPG